MKYNTEEQFQNAVQNMTGKEIIMSMVEGLRNPVTKINMNSFGSIEKDVCIGCAATNTICKINDLKLEDCIEFFSKEGLIGFSRLYANYSRFLSHFEDAIDYLRMGNLNVYNIIANKLKIAILPENEILPYLHSDYTEEELKEYEDFANTLN